MFNVTIQTSTENGSIPVIMFVHVNSRTRGQGYGFSPSQYFFFSTEAAWLYRMAKWK